MLHYSRLCAIGTTFVFAVAASAELRRVPTQYATIQAAINAAQPGDAVVVADGTYTGAGNRDVHLDGKAITVRSENGPANCIIDCQQSGRGFNLDLTHETPDSIIDGFTIRNGRLGDGLGGGILLTRSDPTIRNCVIMHCSAGLGGGLGGGIGCFGDQSPPFAVIADCVISDNTAYAGGGLYVSGGNPLIVRCLINGNVATANQPEQGGGGVYVTDTAAIVRECTIRDNVSSFGGGIGTSLGSLHPLVQRCVLSGNYAVVAGGGFFNRSSSPEFADCVIAGNESGWYGGGGCAFVTGYLFLDRCTIASNRAGYYGGGVYASGPGGEFRGLILAGNSAPYGNQVAIEAGQVSASHCCVYGPGAIYVSGFGYVTG